MLKVNNEIASLKKVLLHRPSSELNVLNNQNKENYLFDEIPDLKIAQNEHDVFYNILKDNGVEVKYLIDLMIDVINKNNLKDIFIKDFLNRINCHDENIYKEFINISDTKEFLINTFNGLNGKIEALPNLYFTRDPFTIIHNGIAIYNMHTDLRKRETIYGEYINKYHDDFKLKEFYTIDLENKIEGGDVELLDDDLLLIGVSQRTNFKAADYLINKLINEGIIKKGLIMEIPAKRSCMHLDTVFNRFDTNKFVIYKEIYEQVKLYLIDDKGLHYLNDNLCNVLSNLLNINDLKLLICDDENEQWNDACNTLCIKPNEIIVYDVNEKMNKLYKELGTKIHLIPSKELLKGRGGPHCMSMPLERY